MHSGTNTISKNQSAVSIDYSKHPNYPRYHGMKVSREEYLDLEEDSFKYDMIDGVLYMSPSAMFEHGKIQAILLHLFRIYLDKYPIGEIVTEIDIFLPDDGDVLRPDITFLLNENLGIVKGHIHGTPNLVCEILSDATAKRDLGKKADRYLANGVKEYWIVDPRDKTMQVWYNENNNWKKEKKDVLPSRVLEGLKISKQELF